MFAKNDVKDQVNSVRDSVEAGACEVRASLKDAADQSCTYIKDNPWAGVGAGAVVGLVIGFLLGKK
ncbi:glycine zipper domain-containing protein [Serratia sp. NPDC078593]|uniref:glycine zipper domain-containing protein n=1 Tax=unclassified Serratia (in: enterobacteria) TaxID=2647522 RepID=UPI0037D1C51B